MIVISRMKDESIVIGDCIRVVVIDVRGDKVRLGIEAPREISIHTREVYDAMQRQRGRSLKEPTPKPAMS